MSGAVVRTFSIVKHLLNPASGLLTSRHIACGLHWQSASPVTKSHCTCQLCCRRCAISGIASGYGAGYSSYSFHGCVNNVFVNKKKLQGEIMNVSFGVSNKNFACIVQARNKTRSTRQDAENEDSDSDQDDALDPDDFDAPPQFKVTKMTVATSRADAVISHALNISRNDLDEIFLKSGLYLNGDKLLKKSVKMDKGDYADVVLEKVEDQLKVKRVKVLKIYSDRTSKDRLILKVRVWKTPFLLPKPEFNPLNS